MSADKKRSAHTAIVRVVYGLLTLLGGFIAAAAWSGIPQLPGQRVIPMFVIVGMIVIAVLVILLGLIARIMNPDK